MQLHFFGILFFVVILNVQCMEITQEDSKWLQTTDDIKHLSEIALLNLKNNSPIHVFDDLYIIRVLQQRKTLAGDRRSVFMKVVVASMYFESCKAEETISVFMIQSKDKSAYETYVTTKPVMKSSYIEKLQKQMENVEMEVEL